MSRDEALSVLATEINRVASIVILGRYCDAYGAERSAEEWLEIHLPQYRRTVALDFGVDDQLFEEISRFWSVNNQTAAPLSSGDAAGR